MAFGSLSNTKRSAVSEKLGRRLRHGKNTLQTQCFQGDATGQIPAAFCILMASKKQETKMKTTMAILVFLMFGSLAQAQTATQTTTAQKVEVMLLSRGIDANVHAEKDARLFVGFSLMSRGLAWQLAPSVAPKAVGFKTVLFSDEDGLVFEYDIVKKSWRNGLQCSDSADHIAWGNNADCSL
jgi:hypothetical protein